ncbi:MAG: sodium-dependent transporter [Oscillospiraceae bacterium]|nr:sodium-dependent transporter [Oscillospiraceae bacterium]
MNNQKTFSSRLGFVLASVGSAVGMGNIWLFPYRVGQYGGAAFLIPYFIFVALFGALGLSGEFGLGRLAKSGPIEAYRHAFSTRKKSGGRFLGAIPLVGSLGIAIGYAIIVGWVARFLFGSFTGDIFKAEPSAYFSQITGSFGSFKWHILVIAITVCVLLFGILKGIERLSKIMMPAFFILFLVLAVRVAFLPGAHAGYEYLLVPKWEFLLKPITWIMAMGQAFFSLSITGSGMIIYGSYLSKKEDVVKVAVTTSLLDTCAALLSSFVIIPAVFAFGMDPMSGPPLMFITMPKIFAAMPWGSLFAVLFFVSVFFAGITSLVNMLEVCTAAAQTQLKLSRTVSTLFVGALTLGIGLFLESEPLLGTWMDWITIYIVPLGAVLGAIVIYWVLDSSCFAKELNSGRKQLLPNWFFKVGKFVYVPLAVIVLCLGIFLGGIG